ncbi:hypothetical protein G7Z17_g12440 [Cylindrodendrum hubeiense]|uniref:Uncharacterized protein n=1 Tax=Cylindrodendrum hubeiense TaxID=595255 RepID=A0A9P5L990_9HYPO|nr:hypothetical protein G7Z17_g12440 [Cylindrodendrum hubeiense]
MEKQSADQRKREWQASQDPIDLESGSLCLTVFCPCGAYGRTSQRLGAALSGRDANNLPEHGIPPDCIQLLVCFPFYGCFIAKLQTTVRSFYDIEGNDYKDWSAGCFCPCATLLRNEKEIMFRERQHRQIKDVNDRDNSVMEQYQSPSPMEHPEEQAVLQSVEHPEEQPAEHPVEQLKEQPAEHRPPVPTLPIPGSPAVTATDSQPDTSTLSSIPEEPSVAAGPATSVDTAVLGIHDIGEDKNLVPVYGTSIAHRLEEDMATFTSPPVINTSHELRHDATTAHMVGSETSHPVEQDRHELFDVAKDESSKHAIHQDQTVPKARPATSHQLQDDTVTPPAHQQSVPHSLDADEATSSKSTTRRPHRLREDK